MSNKIKLSISNVGKINNIYIPSAGRKLFNLHLKATFAQIQKHNKSEVKIN